MRRCVIYAVWLILVFASASAAQPAPRSVLILHSFDIGYTTDMNFARAFRAELSKQSPEPINFFEVSVRPTPSAGDLQEEAVANYLRASLGGQRLDLVMTVSAPAALFARKYREQLFPDTAILLAGVDQRWVQHEVLTASEAVVPIAVDPVRIVEDIMRLRPQTTHLFAVLGSSPLERAWQAELVREFQPLADRLTVTWFNELSFTEMLKRSAALPANSAIFYLLLSVDAKGFTHSEERVLAELHEAANAPIFGAFSHQIGSGVVGGPTLSVDDVARDTASVGVRFLSGESAATIKTGILVSQRPVYDWRELQRWQIPESRLPSGATVRFRPPSLWEERKGFILAGVAVVLFQATLITALLFQRARRRTTEQEMMGLSGRLLTAHEDERRRLARELHDDLTQRLARLAIDAGKLEQGGEVEGNAAGMRKELVRLSEDVHALSYRLHPSMLDDLGLVEALRAECDRVEQHGALRVEVDATHVPDKLPADTSLCLFRVAQEALNNASRHARASAVTVLLSQSDNGIRLAISDNGVGFLAAGTRTRASLGLASMRERVRLQRGHIDIESTPGRGTTVVAWVPA